jgi:hypothetical protein
MTPVPDQPAAVPVERPVDTTLGDIAALVAIGMIEEEPVPSPDPPAPDAP